jgi:hypothetical protein
MTLNFRSLPAIATRADFTYSITPDTISITDTSKGRASVTIDIEAVLRKVEYWHQGIWDGVRWAGRRAPLLTCGSYVAVTR